MKPSQWAPIAVIAAAVGLLGWGGKLLSDQMKPVPAPPPAADKPPVKGSKRPRDFGLPEFPTSTAFVSLEGPRGSSAFIVRRGTAKEIATFYRERLPELGWKFESEKPVTQPLTLEGAVTSEMSGVRLRWSREQPHRRLTLLAFDFIQPRSTAQAVISWTAPK